MKNVILIHGLQSKKEYYNPDKPAPGNNHWFPWLKKQLLLQDYYVDTPLIFQTFKATYEEFSTTIERSFQINENTTLVGHSFGGGFLVRWLSENKHRRVGKVILVAPWMNPFNDPALETKDFFNFTIDSDLVRRTGGVTVFHSTNDEESINVTLEILRKSIKDIKITYFENYGHFCLSDMGTDNFPELLKEIIE